MIEGALVLTLAAAIVKIIGAIYKIPMIAVIGADGNGYYTYAYNIYLVIYSIAVSGFPTAISRIIARYRAQKRYRDVQRVHRISVVFLLCVGLFGSILLALMARPYAEHIIHIPRAFYAIIAVAPSILFSCLMAAERGYNQGLSNMTPTALSQVVEILFKVLFGLGGSYIVKKRLMLEYSTKGTILGAVLQNGEKPEVVIGSLSAAAAIFGVTASCLFGYLFFLALRAMNHDPITRQHLMKSPAPDCDKVILREILRYAVPIAVSSVTVYLAGLIDGVMITNRLIKVFTTDAKALFASHGGLMELDGKSIADAPDEIANYLYGVYGLGTSLYNLIPSITGAFGMSSMPHVTSAFVRKDGAAVEREARSVIRMTMLIAAPAGFGLLALSAPITRFLYGGANPYSAEIAIPMVGMLGLAAIFVALSASSNSLLQSCGMIYVPVVLMAIGAVIKISVNYIFVGVPSINITAVPYGNIACYAIISILGLVILCRRQSLNVGVLGTVIKPIISGGACGVAAFGAYTLFMQVMPRKPSIGLFLGIFAGAAVYFVMLGLLRTLDRDDVLSMPGGRKIAVILEKMHLLR